MCFFLSPISVITVQPRCPQVHIERISTGQASGSDSLQRSLSAGSGEFAVKQVVQGRIE